MLMPFTDGRITYSGKYEVNQRLRQWLTVSDTGDEYAESRTNQGHNVLWEFPAESKNPGAYQRRQGMAVFPALVPQAIDDYIALLEIRKPQELQDIPEAYETLRKDVDGSGITIDQFRHNISREALALGETWLWVDTTVAGEYSEAQQEQVGDRGIIRQISADQVVWWHEYKGSVLSASIITGLPDGRSALYSADRNDHRLSIIEDGKIVDVGEVRPHRFGRCPIIRARPFETPFTKRLADLQREVFNYQSLKREEIFNQVFSLLVGSGIDPSSFAQNETQTSPLQTIGSMWAVLLEEPGASLTRLGATGASAEIGQAENSAVSNFYRVARLSPGSPTEVGIPESGKARQLRLHQQTAILYTLSLAMQSAENQAVRAWASAEGIPYPGDVQWPTEFDAADQPTIINETSAVLSLPELPRTLKQQEWQKFADQRYSLTEDQADQFTTELDEF